MFTKIVEKLKTGSIANVIPFGMEQKLAPPYIVVKPEKDPLGAGRLYRIIVHYNVGQQIFIEDYVRNELENLLRNYKTYSRHNNLNMVLDDEDYDDITSNNDDGTISMERVFLVPSRLF